MEFDHLFLPEGSCFYKCFTREWQSKNGLTEFIIIVIIIIITISITFIIITISITFIIITI